LKSAKADAAAPQIGEECESSEMLDTGLKNMSESLSRLNAEIQSKRSESTQTANENKA
jgi:hypothetical protein